MNDTSALLGMLALKPWRTYDLVREMRRNLQFFWPRAESRLYAELKRLADGGLARIEASFQGARGRKTWHLTPAGAEAFQRWLEAPTGGTSLYSEEILRVFLADPADVTTLRAAVDSVRREAAELRAVADHIAQEYAGGRAPFQERVRARALVFDYLASWAHMRTAWADRADALLAELADQPPAAGDAAAVAHIRARHAAVVASPADAHQAG